MADLGRSMREAGDAAGTIVGGNIGRRTYAPEPAGRGLAWRLWANKVPESENVIVKTEPETPTLWDRITGRDKFK